LKKFTDTITTQEEFLAFREEIGQPSERARNKVIDHIDEHCRTFISKSPFLTVATANINGECDVSPRGDAPGFVKVIDEHHLFIPERPGNKRMDSIHNIISNPHIGLIFFIPSLGETLRMNGKALICRDPELLSNSKANEKTPLFGIVVEVNECYIHCAKAFIRSGLWNPESWLPNEEHPKISKILADHANILNTTTEQIEKDLRISYVERLY